MMEFELSCDLCSECVFSAWLSILCSADLNRELASELGPTECHPTQPRCCAAQ